MITQTDLKEVCAVVIGSAINVAGNATINTVTDFTMLNGISMATHLPLFYIVKYNSGTLGTAQIRTKVGSNYTSLAAMGSLSSLVSGVDIYITGQVSAASPLIMPESGNLGVELVAVGGSAGSFDIYAYGIKRT